MPLLSMDHPPVEPQEVDEEEEEGEDANITIMDYDVVTMAGHPQRQQQQRRRQPTTVI